MRLLAFDTETTNLPLHPNAKDHLQPRIIEFAAAMVDEHGVQQDSIVQLLDPAQKLDPKITKITGITDEDLRGQPAFKDFVPVLHDWFSEADFMVAHNLPFDWTLLTMELARCGQLADWPRPTPICTVQEHAERWGRRPRLLELYEEVMGEPLQQTHRALDDVAALVEILVATGVFDDIAATASS